MRTQFGNKLKLRIKYFGPYQVTKVKPHDRYDVAKIGDHEGPNVTRLFDDIYRFFIENIPNIIFQRNFKKKDYSKKFVPGTCVLSENNWLELQRIHKNITESAMWLAFDRMLRNLLLSEASKITSSAVVYTAASEGELVLTTSLIELLCDYLGNSITDVLKCNGCV
ncbi:PC4 domain-containing protein [Trichonephila clavipes]|nr:PC4 domain-containing protein [Trichonephila clavipes]